MSLKGTEKDGDIKAVIGIFLELEREGREAHRHRNAERQTCRALDRQIDREREKERDCQRWKHKNRET